MSVLVTTAFVELIIWSAHHQALSQEVVALRAELDAIEREAEQLVLERASQSLPPSLLVLPKEVRAIRAEFDAIEREAQSLAAECRAHSIVDPLLPKEVSAIRAEFDAIKRQAQQLAAWVRTAFKRDNYLFVKTCRDSRVSPCLLRGRPRSRK
jgi:chromosome segregation ATPase